MPDFERNIKTRTGSGIEGLNFAGMYKVMMILKQVLTFLMPKKSCCK